jgi:hypothetical protein
MSPAILSPKTFASLPIIWDYMTARDISVEFYVAKPRPN